MQTNKQTQTYTNRIWMMWTAVLVTFLTVYSKALKMLCGNESYIIEVTEDSSSFTMTCYDYQEDGNTEWTFINHNKSNMQIGSCRSGHCNVIRSAMNISSPQRTRSLLTSQYTSRKSGGFIYTCKQNENGASCKVDIIYPASVQWCTLNFTSQPWEVNGACNISKVYSFLGRYECRLYYRNSTATHFVLVHTVPYVPGYHSDPNYRQGLCTFNSSLPFSYGIFSYKMTLVPGNTEFLFVEPIIIEQPSEPVISDCKPKDAILEGSNLSCLCSVENIGKPEGRLLWYGDGTLKHTGSYGVTSLWLSETMGFHNDGVKFECVLEWSNTRQKRHHEANVVLKPHSMKFKINNVSSSTTVNEGSDVLFECLASGKPLPFLHVFKQNNSKPIYSDTNKINNTVYLWQRLPNVNCTDAYEYTCVAENNITGSTAKKVELFVNCKPRTAITRTPPLQVVKYKEKTTLVTIDIVAYPIPDNFTVLFLGSSMDIANVSASLDVKAFQVKCFKLQPVYMHTCAIDVDRVNSSGYYKVIIANSHGQIEKIFQIKFPSEDNLMTVYGPAVGGVIGSLVLVALVLISVYIIIKRRGKGDVYAKVKKPKKSNKRSTHGTVDGSAVSQSNESSPACFESSSVRFQDTINEYFMQANQQNGDFHYSVAMDNVLCSNFECTENGSDNLKASTLVEEKSLTYALLDFSRKVNARL